MKTYLVGIILLLVYSSWCWGQSVIGGTNNNLRDAPDAPSATQRNLHYKP